MKICLLKLLVILASYSAGIKGALEFTARPFDQFSGVHVREIFYGQTLELSCQTNDENADVTLKINNIPSTNPFIGARQKGQNFTMDVKNRSLFNGKEVICEATNGVESVKLIKGVFAWADRKCSEPVIISIGTVLLKKKNSTKEYSYEKNSSFTVFCWSRGGRHSQPALDFSWTDDKGTVLQTTKERYDMYDVARIHIENANRSHAGIYTCSRSISACHANQTTRSSIVLRYKEPFKPKVTAPPTIMGNRGDALDLVCEVSASPAADISWYRNGKRLTDEKNSNKSHCTYRITSVDTEDSGVYECVAINTEGVTRQLVNVSVGVSPKVTASNNKSLRKIICDVEAGYPFPNIFLQVREKCSTTCRNHTWRNQTEGVKRSARKIEFHYSALAEYETFRCFASNPVSVSYSQQIVIHNDSNGGRREGLDTNAVVGIVLGVIIFFFCLLCFLMKCYRSHLQEKYALYMVPDPKFRLDPDRSLFHQSIELPYNPEWEFPKERLQIIRQIGAGAFGQVFLANARGIYALSPRDRDTLAIRRRVQLRLNKRVPKTLVNCFLNDDLCEQSIFVAVKKLKDHTNTTDEYKDLASEIKILIHLGAHENIVNLLGAVTKGGDLSAIMEYCPHGNLVDFLRPRREIFNNQWTKETDDLNEEFSFIDATRAALDIAKGMCFLSQKKLVHRDLAARNILVGNDYVMKIADFGLARDINVKDYYYKQSVGMLPVKWMAPESLFDKMYNVQSDVWSFGIVLWEITTMGGSPYPGLPMENLFEYLHNGNRMQQPATCPNELYEIMRQCWQGKDERPLFHELVSQLERIISSKAVISNNLATFERLRSTSSETDYLVPRSPLAKKGSLDTALRLTKLPSPFLPRKQSADLLRSFPPAQEDLVIQLPKETSNGSPDHPQTLCENHYVDLRRNGQKDEINDNCLVNYANT